MAVDLTDAERELRWYRCLQARHPAEAGLFGEAELRRLIRESFVLCPRLQIDEERDILRFLALALLLTPEQRRSRLVEGVVRRILGNLEWESGKRLDFLYHHLVGRSVSPEEPDFGPSYAPREAGDVPSVGRA